MPASLTDNQLLAILATDRNAFAIYTTQDIVIEAANDAMIAFWGKDRSVIGLPLEEAVPELKGQPFKQMLQQVLLTGIDDKGVIPATTVVNDELHTAYYEYWYRAIKDEAGMPYAIMHTAADVTERTQNQQALAVAQSEAENQQERLYQFFMQAPAGICVLNGPQLAFELVNPLYQALFPGRELLGRDMWDAVPEVEGTAIWDVLQGVYQTGNTFEGNGLLIPLARTTDGSVEDRYFNFIYQARKAVSGKVDGILVFVFEVTDMVNAQQELKKAQDFLELAIEAAEIGIWAADLTNDRLTVTPRTRTIHGFAEGVELTLTDALEMVTDECREQVKNSIAKAVENKTSFVEQYWINPLDGSKPRWLRSNGKAYYNENGDPLYISGTIADLTEQKEDDIRKSDFIGMVSHELKTPLTSLNAIIQVADMKLKNSGDTFLKGAMAKAGIQAKRMSNMINGFLNISRLESGKILLDKQPFNIDGLLREMIEEIAITAVIHQVQFSGCGDLDVFADREKIGSVISNLLSNAVKYSPKGKSIIVRCEKVLNEVVVSVQDEGLGLKKADLEKIFERYFRVETDQTQHIAGFGIGLYLTAEIVKLHKGRIWAESEIGEGSTFYFSLPL